MERSSPAPRWHRQSPPYVTEASPGGINETAAGRQLHTPAPVGFTSSNKYGDKNWNLFENLYLLQQAECFE